MQVKIRLEGVDKARLTALASAAGSSVEETAHSILACVLADDARMHETAAPAAQAPEIEIGKAQIKTIKAFASVGNDARWIARRVDLPVGIVKSILKSK